VKIIGNSGDHDYQEMVTGDNLILACEVSVVSSCGSVVYTVNIEVCCHFAAVVLCCLDTHNP